MDAGAVVKDARHRVRLSQRELAERAGVRRTTIAQIESGARTPSLGMLVGLLAAAGLQMRVELEPLDADVRRAIEERRTRNDATEQLLATWGGFHAMDQVGYRIEGLAAAVLLGAPVPVAAIGVALADVPATYAWLAERLRCADLRIRVDDEHRPDDFGLGRWGDRDGECDTTNGEDVDTVRARLAEECPEGRFELVGWLDEMPARLAPADEVARCVQVATSEKGTVRVQPLDEIECADPQAARVLRVMREGTRARESTAPRAPRRDGRILG